MGNRMWVVASILVLVGLSAALPAVGEAADMGGGAKYTLSLTKDSTASPWTSEVGYGTRAISKLGFGIKNLLLGWTDLIVEPQDSMSAGGNFFTGLGIGLKDAVENTLGGVVHIVTFPITAIDVPLPEGGTQLLSS